MLELKNVKKSYDGTPVLTDISLNIEDGEIVSILGPSGCGKTTLLNLILGIVDSDGGQIIYNGQDITNVPMEKRGFNIVFQDYALFPNLNVYQNITYGLRNSPEISSREEVEDLIHLLGLEEHGKVVKEKGRVFIVDAMSSFGGVDIPVKDWGIDFIISSANKCIQGVPGFSFIIARRDLLEASAGKARSLSLDLYDQWKTMEVDGKWRFTSPTHVVLAFAQAMKELEEEGGIEARSRRYTENNRLLIEKMAEMGIRPYIDSTHQGPIITTFFYPEECHFTFSQMYEYIKDRGYAIYPGKVTEAETFRIGNIGEIYPEDIEKVCAIIKEFLEEYNHEEN